MKSAMDKELLNALDNLSFALEEVAKSLDKKEGAAKSATGEALQSGDFAEHLTQIKEGLQSIKDDTSKILDNQQTIIKLQKEQSNNKASVFEEPGQKGKKKQMMKDGIGIILLIAAAVLAIGMAFKLIGTVDFASVIAISVALPLIAIAFERIAQIKGLTIRRMLELSIITTLMAVAVTASSLILSMVSPLTIPQLITTVLLSGAFVFMAQGLAALITAMESEDEVGFGPFKAKKKGIKLGTILAASGAVILIMLAASLAIVASSYILANVQTLTLPQLITVVILGLVFGFIGQGLAALVTALTTEESGSIPGLGSFKKKGMNLAVAAAAALLAPIIMIGVSFAIMASSHILARVVPISIMQGLTAIFIAGVFTILSYGLGKILSAVQGVNPVQAIVAGLILVGLAYAITEASKWFSQITPISLVQFLTALGISIVFVVLAFAAMLMFKAIKDLTIAQALVGTGIILALAAAVLGVSYLLSQMPDVDLIMILKFALVAIAVAVVALALGLSIILLSKLGLNPMTAALGSLSILILATTVALSSHILSMGNYEKYPSLDWALGTSLVIGAFGLLSVLLGYPLIMALSALGSITILLLAETVKEVSNVLSGGDYSYGADLSKWVEGVIPLFITFSGLFLIMGAAGFFSSILGWFGADPMVKAKELLLDIAETIVDVAGKFKGVDWSGGPPKEWAEGVSMSIGAFSDVYFKLNERSIWDIFSSGPSPEDFANSIKIISEGIIFAGFLFSMAPDNWKGGPTKAWAEGVGGAINAFAPAMQFLAENQGGFFTSGIDMNELKRNMGLIVQGIVEVAYFFNQNKVPFEGNYPKKAWGDGVGSAIKSFTEVFEFFYEGSNWTYSDIMDSKHMTIGIAESITSVASFFDVFVKSGGRFMAPKKEVVADIAESLMIWATLMRYISMTMPQQTGGVIGAIGNLLVGEQQDPLVRMADSIVRLGSAFKQLNEDIKELDVEKLEAIRGFTGNVIMLSLMDPEQFDAMMEKFEERAGVFVDIYKDFQETKKGGEAKGGVKVGGPAAKPEQSETKILIQKVDVMTAILGDIAKGVGSNGYLKKYLSTLKDDSFLKSSNSPTSK